MISDSLFYLSENLFQPRPALFKMDGWTHRSRFVFYHSILHASIYYWNQASSPHPTSTSTNMTELCMLSCSKRDSLQSGRDLHNLCSLGHQCDPSCNSSQSPPPPPAGICRHELTGTDKLLWPVTSAQTSHQPGNLMASNASQSLRLPDAVPWQLPVRVHTVKHKERGGCLCCAAPVWGDWRRSTQGLSPLTLRQGLTHQCPPYKMLPTVTINVFIWTHGTEVAAVSHSAGILALIEIWSN